MRTVQTSPAHRGQVYVPAVNWFLLVGLRRPGVRLPILDPPRRRLRRCGHAHDGDHDPARRLDRPAPLGLVSVEARHGPRSPPGRRRRVRLGQPVQDPGRRLVPLVVGVGGFVIFTTWRTGRRVIASACRACRASRSTTSSPVSPRTRRLATPAPASISTAGRSGPAGTPGQPPAQRQPPRHRRVRLGHHRRPAPRQSRPNATASSTTTSASTSSRCATASSTPPTSPPTSKPPPRQRQLRRGPHHVLPRS